MKNGEKLIFTKFHWNSFVFFFLVMKTRHSVRKTEKIKFKHWNSLTDIFEHGTKNEMTMHQNLLINTKKKKLVAFREFNHLVVWQFFLSFFISRFYSFLVVCSVNDEWRAHKITNGFFLFVHIFSFFVFVFIQISISNPINY